jgi:hypothetical protein
MLFNSFRLCAFNLPSFGSARWCWHHQPGPLNIGMISQSFGHMASTSALMPLSILPSTTFWPWMPLLQPDVADRYWFSIARTLFRMLESVRW